MKIGERGQVTIPKKLRDAFGLLPHIEVEFVPEKDGIKLRKKSSRVSPVQKVFGILKKMEPTDDYIEKIRGR